jgi:hypothetical protein
MVERPRLLKIALHQLRNRLGAAGPHAGGRGRLAALAPQFQSGWRIPLKAPIKLSNINLRLALRLITAMQLVRSMRVKRTMRTKLLLVTTTSHGGWSFSSAPDYYVEQVAPSQVPRSGRIALNGKIVGS